MPHDPYLLGHSEQEERRLQRQSLELAHESRWLLEQLALEPGARALDLGCGPGGILDLLAEQVGPTGRVVGLERNPQTAALARRFVRERGLAGVEIVEADGRTTGLPRASFDLVHARLVLCNVPVAEEILQEMIALTRPGGVVASHEADYLPHRCEPSHPSWERLLELHEAHARDEGIDLFVGRRTFHWFHAAGLVDVRVRPIIHVYPGGHPRRCILLDFIANIRAPLLASRRIGEDELDAHVVALKEHLARPDVLVVSHAFFQVWGRRAT